MQPQSFAEANSGIINGNSKCIPVSPASPFSSRSLTPSPQQTVYQPVSAVIKALPEERVILKSNPFYR